MNSEIIIQNVNLDVIDLEKRASSLRNIFLHKQKNYNVEIRVLHDISLHLKTGDKIGIIGRNGSGKSTLLRLMTGVYPPKDGNVEIRGKVLAMIDQYIGFNHVLTGRDNIKLGFIYNNNYIQYTKELELKIIDFIEFNDNQIDMPFYTYSSGMKARLLFAASFFQEGNIVLMDEVFATGDEYFIKKAYSEMTKKWKEIEIGVFISHNPEEVLKLCKESILIEKGRIIEKGDTSKILEIYHKTNE